MWRNENKRKKWKCIVPSCDYQTPTHYNRIPTREWIAKKWSSAIQSTVLDGVKIADLNKYFVCSAHFKSTDYSKNTSRRILDGHVVPSVNMPPGSEEPRENVNIIQNRVESPATPIIPVHCITYADFTVCEKSLSRVVQDSPLVVQEPLVVKDPPVHQEQPVIQESPAAEESHVVQKPPEVQKPPVTQESPVIEQSPAAEKRQEPLISPSVQAYIDKIRRDNRILRGKLKSERQKARGYKKKVKATKEILKEDRNTKWDKLSDPQRTLIQSQLRNAGRGGKVWTDTQVFFLY